jgi:hypothetical protein
VEGGGAGRHRRAEVVGPAYDAARVRREEAGKRLFEARKTAGLDEEWLMLAERWGEDDRARAQARSKRSRLSPTSSGRQPVDERVTIELLAPRSTVAGSRTWNTRCRRMKSWPKGSLPSLLLPESSSRTWLSGPRSGRPSTPRRRSSSSRSCSPRRTRRQRRRSSARSSARPRATRSLLALIPLSYRFGCRSGDGRSCGQRAGIFSSRPR